MELTDLCRTLGIRQEVIDTVNRINGGYEHDKLSPIWEKLYDRSTWDDGIKQLQEHFGEDKDGMKMFTCILNCTLYTHRLYAEKGIDEQIFIDTMRFLTRFLERDRDRCGYDCFTWAWWFPRELSLQEFRIGALEYELASEEGMPRIYMHIPSDADMGRDSLQSSYKEFQRFLGKFFPEYRDAEMYCDSWLLEPVLKQFLKSGSGILYFQSCFEVISVDKESNGFMDWLYGGDNIPLDRLPENTSLQKRVKQYLLEGGKVGWALGKFKGFM